MLRTLGKIIISILYPLSIATAFARPALTLFGRRAASLVYPREAPMIHCDYPDILSSQYCVFLHHGSSLEKHTARVALDSATITNVFPESYGIGVAYCAKGISEAVLKGIRRDVVVDLVECSRVPDMGGFFEGEIVHEIF